MTTPVEVLLALDALDVAEPSDLGTFDDAVDLLRDGRVPYAEHHADHPIARLIVTRRDAVLATARAIALSHGGNQWDAPGPPWEEREELRGHLAQQVEHLVAAILTAYCAGLIERGGGEE